MIYYPGYNLTLMDVLVHYRVYILLYYIIILYRPQAKTQGRNENAAHCNNPGTDPILRIQILILSIFPTDASKHSLALLGPQTQTSM